MQVVANVITFVFLPYFALFVSKFKQIPNHLLILSDPIVGAMSGLRA